MVNKMADFCYGKVYIRLQVHSQSICKKVREKATKCSLKATEVLLDTDGYVFT